MPCLDKQEISDANYMRYGWKIDVTPNHCVCEVKTQMFHSLMCKLDGCTSLRHSSVRKVETQFMRDVCQVVQTEPFHRISSTYST